MINHRHLKQQAADRLCPEFRKLTLLHTAVTMGVLFLLAILGVVLERAINSHQGLSGMAGIGMLQTVQSTLSAAVNLLLPFWEVGIVYAAMRTVRRQDAAFPVLRQGFLRFGPMLRYYLLLTLMFIGVAIACMNFLMPAMVLMPIPPSFQEMMLQMDMTVLEDPEQFYAMLSAIPYSEMVSYTVRILAICTLPYFAIILHLHYRFRFAPFLLLDETPSRALPALVYSNQLTRGHKWQLFKLDLSFWWYYLLQAAASAIVFLPDILTALGATLPLPADALYLLCYGVYALCSLAIAWFAGAYVQLTFATAYEQLLPPPPEAENL